MHNISKIDKTLNSDDLNFEVGYVVFLVFCRLALKRAFLRYSFQFYF